MLRGIMMPLFPIQVYAIYYITRLYCISINNLHLFSHVYHIQVHLIQTFPTSPGFLFMFVSHKLFSRGAYLGSLFDSASWSPKVWVMGDDIPGTATCRKLNRCRAFTQELRPAHDRLHPRRSRRMRLSQGTPKLWRPGSFGVFSMA